MGQPFYTNGDVFFQGGGYSHYLRASMESQELPQQLQSEEVLYVCAPTQGPWCPHVHMEMCIPGRLFHSVAAPLLYSLPVLGWDAGLGAPQS